MEGINDIQRSFLFCLYSRFHFFVEIRSMIDYNYFIIRVLKYVIPKGVVSIVISKLLPVQQVEMTLCKQITILNTGG